MRVPTLIVTFLLLSSAAIGQNWGPTRSRPVVRFEVPWDKQTAAHFARRAGFSASPEELTRYVEQGFEATLDEYLNFEAVENGAAEAALAAQAYQLTFTNMNNREVPFRNNMIRWWLFRMIHSRHQLVEKMTYFWHDHFATSVAKVNAVSPDHVPLVMAQNQLFRQYALGNFKELVHQVARDPAMLLWLDNYINLKDNPNENWGRELLELFTVGIGNYSEDDIQEAARAFTGWTLQRGTLDFIFIPFFHDYGNKEFMGQSGALDGDDVIDIIFEQPVTAEFIARKVFEFLVYPSPSDTVVKELAGVFRNSGYEIRTLLEAIFEHREFFSEKAYRAQVKSPVELVVSTYRELGISDPVRLPGAMRLMDQELFLPPDVGGWTSGSGWLNTTTLLSRYNFFNAVATRRGGLDYFDVQRLISENNLSDPSGVTSFFLDLLVQNDASNETYYTLTDYLSRDPNGLTVEFDIENPIVVDMKVRGLVYLTMILPVYQLN